MTIIQVKRLEIILAKLESLQYESENFSDDLGKAKSILLQVLSKANGALDNVKTS